MSPITLTVSYTSVSLMQTMLPDLGSLTTLTSAQMAFYAGQAEADINARIARHYSLPLTVEVPVLTAHATTIAVYYTVSRRLFTSERLANSPWPDRFKEAVSVIDEIATGAVPLVNSSGALVGARTDVAEVYSTTKDYVPTHWEGPWEHHVVDEDKLDDEYDRRGLSRPYLK